MARRKRTGPPPPEKRPEPEVTDWEDMTEEELDAIDIYGRDDLSVADLNGEEIELTMRSFRVVEFEGFSEGDPPKPKLEIKFDEHPKTLCPGKQVIMPVVRAFGSQVSQWKGKRVVLFPDRWANGGRSGDRVGMRPVTGRRTTNRKRKPKR